MKLFLEFIKRLYDSLFIYRFNENEDEDTEDDLQNDFQEESVGFLQRLKKYMLGDYEDEYDDECEEDSKIIPPPINVPNKETYQIAHQGDYTLIILALVISFIGAVTLLGITVSNEDALGNRLFSVDMFFKHLVFIGIGLFVMIAVSFINYRRLIKYGIPASIAVWVLVILSLIFGEKINGASGMRVLFGGLTLNTAKLLYLPVILLLPYILSKNKDVTMKVFFLGVLAAGMSAGLALIQYSLPTAVLIFLIAVLLLFIKKPILASFILSGVIAVFIYYQISMPYSSLRISAWLDPFSDPLGLGWRTIQSLYAIASGGFFGQGLGSEDVAIYLPNAESGYILSTISYQIGFVGAIIVLLLLILIISRIGLASAKSKDVDGFYLCVGICIYFTLSIIVNTLVVVGVVPPMNYGGLPLAGYGGTNLMLDMFFLGIALNVSKYSTERPLFAKGGRDK